MPFFDLSERLFSRDLARRRSHRAGHPASFVPALSLFSSSSFSHTVPAFRMLQEACDRSLVVSALLSTHARCCRDVYLA